MNCFKFHYCACVNLRTPTNTHYDNICTCLVCFWTTMNPNLIWFTCWFKELLKLLKKFITYSRCWLWNKGYYLKLVDFSFDFYYFRIHWLVCLKIDVSSKPMWLKITSFVLGYFTFLHCTLYLKKYDLIHVVTNTLCNCNQVFQIIFWHATFILFIERACNNFDFLIKFGHIWKTLLASIALSVYFSYLIVTLC